MCLRRRWLSTHTDHRNLIRMVNNQKTHPMKNLKQFTQVQDAPDHVLHRTVREPDAPEDATALDVAVVGRPNAGKSSLMNRLLDFKVSAVSQKYNTTRHQVLGIKTQNKCQISFFDTPGLVNVSEKQRYVRPLVTSAVDAVHAVDMTMLVVDAVKRLDPEAMQALEEIVENSLSCHVPLMLVLNKVDLSSSDDKLVKTAERLNLMIQKVAEKQQQEQQEPSSSESSEDVKRSALMSNNGRIGASFYGVSALRGSGMPQLLRALEKFSLPRPWSHHSSTKSDLSELDLVEEIIREKLFQRFHAEIPYEIQQENRGWTYFRDGSVRIDQDVIVPSLRLKRMMIGTSGRAIRSVGIAARQDISKMLASPVHLYLNVRKGA